MESLVAKNQKILLISQPRYNSSTWGRHQEVARALAKCACEVIYLEPIIYSSPRLPFSHRDIGENPVPPGVTVIKRRTRLSRGILYLIYAELKNLFDFLEHDPNVVIIYSSKCMLASIAAKIKRRKIIFDYVDDVASLHNERIMKLFVKYLYIPLIAILSNSIITTSSVLRDDICRYNKKTFLIPNGVDLQEFNKQERHRINTNESRMIVGFIGALASWVDVDMIVSAAKRLDNLDFVIVGDGEELDYLRHSTKNLTNFRVVGPIPHEDIPEAISKFDICIIPFKINYLTDRVCPVKLFEYWAAKKPVISTAFSEIQKIGDDALILVRDKEEFINRLRILSRDSDLRKTLSNKGYEKVYEKYNWDKIGKDYSNIITSAA